jgi:hypothetical protein
MTGSSANERPLCPIPHLATMKRLRHPFMHWQPMISLAIVGMAFVATSRGSVTQARACTTR